MQHVADKSKATVVLISSTDGKKTAVNTSIRTHTQRCALAWGFAAVKGVGNGLLRVLLRLLLRVGNVKGAVCGGPVGRTCAGWLTDVCEDVKVGG